MLGGPCHCSARTRRVLRSVAGGKLSGCMGSQSGADTKGRLSSAAIQAHGRGSSGNQDL